MTALAELSDIAFESWLATVPTEDELRDAYVLLEEARSRLWTSGSLDSFRRDRYDLDAAYVTRLVRIKWALASCWAQSGQFAGFTRASSLA